jgi:hypothetical protein
LKFCFPTTPTYPRHHPPLLPLQAAQAARGTRPDPTDRPGRPEYDEEKILVSFEGKMPPGLVSVIDGIGYLKVNRGNGETVEKALKRAEKLPGKRRYRY